MSLFGKIRDRITSEEYLKPGVIVDSWLEKKYSELIRRLERKYPKGTITGVSTEDFDICKIFSAYKKRFGVLYNHQDLEKHFEDFWMTCMWRDSRLQAVWSLETPSWEYYNSYFSISYIYRDINRHNVIIWNNREEPIDEEYVKAYFGNYVDTVFATETFKNFSKKFRNVLTESTSSRHREYFTISENPHLMAIKCFGNLTYLETFNYFKDALQFGEKFEITLRDYGENFEDYSGFPKDRGTYYSSKDNRSAWINIEFDVVNMRCL